MTDMDSKKVTMQEIADRVGVSKYAVSKALSGKAGISTATRAKIFETASQLGYTNTRKLKNLESRTAAEAGDRIAAVLIPNIRSQNQESGYWGRVLDGISKKLEARGLDSILISDDSPRNFSLVVKPEGLLGIIGVGQISPELLQEIRSQMIPFVLVDHEDEVLDSDTVFMNNFDLLRRMTRTLQDRGHTRLQFVGDPAYSRSFFDRWCGFKAAAGAAEGSEGGPFLKITPGGREGNMAALLGGLQALPAERFPTAFVCANDQIAAYVLQALEQLGRRVPEDCAVTGFDHNLDVVRDYPELTTVNVEKEALGAQAVDLLLWRLENPDTPYQKVLLQSRILIRKSMGL